VRSSLEAHLTATFGKNKRKGRRKRTLSPRPPRAGRTKRGGGKKRRASKGAVNPSPRPRSARKRERGKDFSRRRGRKQNGIGDRGVVLRAAARGRGKRLFVSFRGGGGKRGCQKRRCAGCHRERPRKGKRGKGRSEATACVGEGGELGGFLLNLQLEEKRGLSATRCMAPEEKVAISPPHCGTAKEKKGRGLRPCALKEKRAMAAPLTPTGAKPARHQARWKKKRGGKKKRLRNGDRQVPAYGRRRGKGIMLATSIQVTVDQEKKKGEGNSMASIATLQGGRDSPAMEHFRKEKSRRNECPFRTRQGKKSCFRFSTAPRMHEVPKAERKKRPFAALRLLLEGGKRDGQCNVVPSHNTPDKRRRETTSPLDERGEEDTMYI